MTTALPLPSTMTLQDWADQVVFCLDNYGLFPKLNDANWHDWAACFLLTSSLGNKDVPDPYGFKEWKEWAQRFVQALS